MHTTLAHCIKWHTAHTRMFVMHTMMHLAIAHYCTHHTWHTQKFVMHTRLLLSVGFNARLTAAPLCTKALFHTFNQNFSYNDQNFSYNNQNFSYLEPKLFIQQPKRNLFRRHAFCYNSISPSLFTELIVVLTVTAGWCQFYWLMYCLFLCRCIFPDDANCEAPFVLRACSVPHKMVGPLENSSAIAKNFQRNNNLPDGIVLHGLGDYSQQSDCFIGELRCSVKDMREKNLSLRRWPFKSFPKCYHYDMFFRKCYPILLSSINPQGCWHWRK